ncbi:hypothetical protein DX283_01595 [Salmonella enterica]|nr:hypothetical protein [Salmonella enterica subsp. enterica]EAB3302923.1 hypothetical protein [Salmonella enterica]EBS3634800.1 hypothetical protein [Salmonella enterica subsp. enterica serovar Apapa]EAM6285008.1 hypothetical protein [Salmonella enterica]EAN5957009.1 hypothetical protein [Salmonella enterica]
MLEIRLAELALKILTRRYFGGVSQGDSQNPISVCTPKFYVPPVRQSACLIFSKVSNAIPRIGYPVAQRYPPQPVCRTQALMLMEASDDLFFTCLFYAITLSAVGGSYG